MELFLNRPQKWAELYNCSKIDIDSVPMANRFHPIHGTIIILMFVVFELLYLPCLLAIRKHLAHSCYKLLFYIGIVDMAMMLFQGLESGVYCFTGEVFCSQPMFNYGTGCVSAIFFATETSADFLLALDRCMEMISQKWSKMVFGGNKTWIWLSILTLYGVYYFFFVQPGLYSGIYMNWFMNPYQGYSVQIDYNDYVVPVTFYYNMLLTFGFPVVYALFVALFMWRMKQAKSASSPDAARNFITTFQKIVFIQAVTISGLNLGTSLLFAVMQRLPMNPTLIIVGFYFNYLIFGFPPFVYLAVNRTIRSEFRKIVGGFFWRIASAIYKVPPPGQVNSSGMPWAQHQHSRTVGNRVSVVQQQHRAVQSRH